jgi:hypothetical protein
MLGRQIAALGEAAAGEDVAMRRSHVAFVRTVFSNSVYEGSYREDVLGVGPTVSSLGFIEYSLGRPRTKSPSRRNP